MDTKICRLGPKLINSVAKQKVAPNKYTKKSKTPNFTQFYPASPSSPNISETKRPPTKTHLTFFVGKVSNYKTKPSKPYQHQLTTRQKTNQPNTFKPALFRPSKPHISPTKRRPTSNNNPKLSPITQSLLSKQPHPQLHLYKTKQNQTNILVSLKHPNKTDLLHQPNLKINLNPPNFYTPSNQPP